jgi:bifunctional DNA-binding transcriptional regulator/antitoxin component of YhaV-PrlF toxin-antitoxin module
MVPFKIMKKRTTISRGGQVSIPAVVRRRWATSTVVLEDLGDRLVIQPAADDPIAAAEGALARELGEVNIARLRRTARADERTAEERRAP